MATNTPNINLVKPAPTENYDISIINENSDKIDEGVKAVDDRVSNIIAQSGTSDTEVVDARGSSAILKDRLDSSDVVIANQKKFATNTDFMYLAKTKMKFTSISIVKSVLSPADFSIYSFYTPTKYVRHRFYGNAYDDYIILGQIALGSVQTLPALATTTTDYASKTGTWATTSPNYYASVVGATFTFDFTGYGFTFKHLTDNRGGVWSIVIDGGTPILISTWNANSILKTDIVTNSLANTSHTVVGTFMGDDPLHVPSGGAGTSRGWFYRNTTTPEYAFVIYDQMVDTKVDIIDVFSTLSNKEFAFSMRPALTAFTHRFFPMHSSVGTAFKINDFKIYLDGIETALSTITTIDDVSHFQLIQSVNCVHPDYANDLIEMHTIHDLALDGVMNIDGKSIFLEDVEINNGYACMMPVNGAFCKEVVSGLGNRYTTEVPYTTYTNMTNEGDDTKCFAFVGSATPNYVGVTEFRNNRETLRFGESGRRNPMLYIEHRSEAIQKLYPSMFYDTTVGEGTVYRFGASYLVADIPNIFNLI